MTVKTEAQIMENWKRDQPSLVSVICLTYNQEHYINDAIKSFLTQETNFPFEIIIQDDASTDGTAEIIRNYVKKYPNIIKPVFQKENQFSQKNKDVLVTAVSYANSEYLAYCEGDDYWTDPKKLQVQISEMQKHPNCSISFHPILRIFPHKKKRMRIIAQHANLNKKFNTKELILGGSSFCPSPSFVFRASLFKLLPKWFFDVPIGDYFLQILASLNDGALYINRVMAVYRVNSIGSWSERMSKDENYAYNYFSKMLISLDAIDSHTNKKYTKEFNIIRKKLGYIMCINPIFSAEKRKRIYMENRARFGFKRKVLWYLVFRNQKLSALVFNARNYFFN